MEFHVQLAGPLPDREAVDEAILAADPAAVIDIDAAGQTLRVAASVDADELIRLLGRAGYPVSTAQVRQLPSICCGGCSG